MTSEVGICKLALSHLGDQATITSLSPPDGTTQSALCAVYYPIARGALLEMYHWPFATKRGVLAEVTNGYEDDWSYAYALPSTCLRPLTAFYPGLPARDLGTGNNDATSHPYIVEAADDGSPIMYTNVETAYLRYIDLITDTTRYSPLFVVALARLLASYLAGPILQGKTGLQVAQGQFQAFQAEFRAAAVAAANTGRRDFSTNVPAWVAARGGLPLTSPTQ